MADDEKLVEEILSQASGEMPVSDDQPVDIDALFASMAAEAEAMEEIPVEEPAEEPVVEEIPVDEPVEEAALTDTVPWANIDEIPPLEEVEENKEENLISEESIEAAIGDLIQEETEETPSLIMDDIASIVNELDSVSPIEEPAPALSEMPEVSDFAEQESVAIEEPVMEEPVMEEPVMEEPVMEEPVMEEPVMEEPVMEEVEMADIPELEQVPEASLAEASDSEEFSTENIEAMLESINISDEVTDISDEASDIPEEMSSDIPSEIHEEATDFNMSDMIIPADVSQDSLGDAIDEVIAEESLLDNPILEDIPADVMTEKNNMSVEDIVAEVNDTKAVKKFDFSACFEISIGENGGSYIALKLNTSALGNVFDLPADGVVSAMFMGNCISIARDGKILRKNLLTGEVSEKEVSDEVIESMNKSISISSSINSERVTAKPELSNTISALLSLSADSSVEMINGELRDAGSRLSISINPEGAMEVSDCNGIIHSLEEILWILSF